MIDREQAIEAVQRVSVPFDAEFRDGHRQDLWTFLGPIGAECVVDAILALPVTVTEEMVERAAQVLQRRYEETGAVEDIRAWDSPEIDDEARDAYRDDAHAALEAALNPREPGA